VKRRCPGHLDGPCGRRTPCSRSARKARSCPSGRSGPCARSARSGRSSRHSRSVRRARSSRFFRHARTGRRCRIAHAGQPWRPHPVRSHVPEREGRSRIPWWVFVSAVAAPVLLVGGWTIAAAQQPHGYDPVRDTISALAAQGAADRWIMTSALAGVGACYVVTAAGLRPARAAGRVVFAAAVWRPCWLRRFLSQSTGIRSRIRWPPRLPSPRSRFGRHRPPATRHALGCSADSPRPRQPWSCSGCCCGPWSSSTVASVDSRSALRPAWRRAGPWPSSSHAC
jgi:uncharacterized protein DUF998